MKNVTRKKQKMGKERTIRIVVFRSNKSLYLQLIDDMKGQTVVGVSEKHVDTKGTRMEKAKALGQLLAKKAKEKKIEKVVFDKSGYSYHGLVKAAAEGAREGGLVF